MNDVIIQTDKITYVIGTNEVHTLRDVDLTVRRGEPVAVRPQKQDLRPRPRSAE